MIVLDASILGPIVLLDEVPLPPALVAALSQSPLAAPAHWPIEVANLCLVAFRRGRLDRPALTASFDVIAALRVQTAPPPDMAACGSIAHLAEQEQLSAHDAAYLHLALARSAPIATLDRSLAAAARRHSIEILTIP